MKGVFRTSIVMVSAQDCEGAYRSLEDAPAHVRARLERSTSGPNCATIIIADRRGRRELVEALGARTQVGLAAALPPRRLTPFLKVAVFIVLLMLFLLAALAVIALRWR